MLTYKRPGTGIDPRQMDVVVGRMARVDIPEDTTLTWEMV
jgi:sialic acid synthase SpsE